MSKSFVYKVLLTLVIGCAGLWAGLQFGQSQNPTFVQAQSQTKKSTGAASQWVSFSLPDLDGNKLSPENWKGKVILINFWATWCPPCREEIPLFIEQQKKYQAKGFQMVGIALDRAKVVKTYAKEIGINYPILVADTEGMDVMLNYGGRALPFSVLITRDQLIHSRKLGVFKKEELDPLIKKLL